jgi:hypothetical protein
LTGHRSVEAVGGGLKISFDGGSVMEALPRAYYLDDPGVTISARFELLDDHRFSFAVPDRDARRALVIDPLVYSTFIGSSSADSGKAVDLDASGCPYITGTTQSSSFPTTNGAYDTALTGGRDVFVSKFDASGSKLVYSTFIGGTDTSSMWEEGVDLSVDLGGNATVLADTDCSDFPTTSGAYDGSFNGNTDLVVFRLNMTGMGLVYSTFIGGSNRDSGCSMDLDEDGSVYIVGDTFSSDLPTTAGAYDSSLTGTVDILVAKLDPNGSALRFLTYLGQDGYAGGIAHDATGVFATGSTWMAGHPTTAGAYDRSANGGNDIFVTKFNTLGTSLLYSTFIGGSTHDYATSIEVDANGNACIAGTSWSSNFPTTSGAYDTTSNNIHSNGIVLKLNATGASLVFSSYLGGSGTLGEVLRGLALDPAGNVYIAGDTDSTNYPTTAGAYDTTHSGGGSDCVLSVMNNAGTTLAYSTFFGGTGADYCYGIVRFPDGNVTLTGQTLSSDFPTGPGSYDTTHNGGGDAYVMMLNFSVRLPPSPPMNLTGDMGKGFISISWEAPEYDGGAKVLAYSITRGAPGEPGTMIDTVGQASRSYNDTTVTIGKPYWYSLACNNSAGRSPQSAKVLVRDDRPPSISDLSGVGTARIGQTFNVTATVRDDIVLGSVKCEHWFGDGAPYISDMGYEGNDLWSLGFMIEDTVLPLHCRLTATDVCGNTAISSVLNISVQGSVLPIIGEDTSDGTAYTGNVFTLRTGASDDFGLRRVFASVAGIGQREMNISLEAEEGDVWVGSVTVPSDQEESIAYSFSAQDIGGNWNSTVMKEVQVIDDDPPQFRVDGSSSTCSAGCPFDTIVSYHDNIGVHSVVLNYSWTGSFEIEKDMAYQGAGYWKATIVVPDSASLLHYHTTASDAQGNIASSQVRGIEVIDAQWPEILSDLSPGEATCGSDHRFRFEVRDNRGVDTVWVEYWFGEGQHERLRCEESGGTFEGSVAVPFDSTDPLSYYLHVTDMVGNENVSDVRSVTVFDRTPPTLDDLPDVGCLLGQRVRLRVDPFDNIGLASVVWEGGRLRVEGSTFEWTAVDPGVHRFNVTAADRSGNIGSSVFNITVPNSVFDTDSDGIGDLIELENGLDPLDPGDASLDRDSDGLTNLAEVLKGTEISDDDTDMDGMPDGWEVQYGLDPLRYSSEEDTDMDGVTDLREYLGSTDPTAPDDERGTEGAGWGRALAAVLFVASAVILIGTVLAAVRARRKGPTPSPVPSEGPPPEPPAAACPTDRPAGPPIPGPSPPERPPSVDDWLEAAMREYDERTSSVPERSVADMDGSGPEATGHSGPISGPGGVVE